MTNRRSLSWSNAMREMRNGRATRAGIREERLRSTAGIPGAAGMTTWQGASGRRYVAAVRTLSAVEAADLAGAVVLAVRRGQDGVARLLDVAAFEPGTRGEAARRWITRSRLGGAGELHVHLLAENAAERAAICRDLQLEVDDEGAATA